MKQSWTSSLEPEAAQEIKRNYAESLVMRKRLTKLIEDKIRLNQQNSRSKSSYDNPNWAYLQADACGYERALSELISLIE